MQISGKCMHMQIKSKYPYHSTMAAEKMDITPKEKPIKVTAEVYREYKTRILERAGPGKHVYDLTPKVIEEAEQKFIAATPEEKKTEFWEKCRVACKKRLVREGAAQRKKRREAQAAKKAQQVQPTAQPAPKKRALEPPKRISASELEKLYKERQLYLNMLKAMIDLQV